MPTPMRSRDAVVDTGDLWSEETGSEPSDVRRRGRRESPPEDLGQGDPCDKRSEPHDGPQALSPSRREHLFPRGHASGDGHILTTLGPYRKLAENKHTRGRSHLSGSGLFPGRSRHFRAASRTPSQLPTQVFHAGRPPRSARSPSFRWYESVSAPAGSGRVEYAREQVHGSMQAVRSGPS